MKTFKQFLIEKKVIVYHGSKDIIDEFKYEYCNKGNDQLGSGFYFTTDKDEAKGYGSNIHQVVLNIKKPLDADKLGSMTFERALFFIKRSPDLDDALSNWGDIEREGKNKVMRNAAENYTFKNENLVKGLFNIANDFYGDDIKRFNYSITMSYGYDGIIKHHENGIDHYVAFFPEQIKILGIDN